MEIVPHAHRSISQTFNFQPASLILLWLIFFRVFSWFFCFIFIYFLGEVGNSESFSCGSQGRRRRVRETYRSWCREHACRFFLSQSLLMFSFFLCPFFPANSKFNSDRLNCSVFSEMGVLGEFDFLCFSCCLVYLGKILTASHFWAFFTILVALM